MLSKQNFFGKRDEPLLNRDTKPIGSTTSPSAAAGNPIPPKAATTQSPLVGSSASSPISGPTSSSISGSTASATPTITETKKPDTIKTEPGSGSRLIVGPDVKLRGAEILDCDTLVVEGRVEATMDSRVIHIAENGSFSGKVCIDVAEIHGVFEGELTARSQLIIHATGRVSGKIRYGKILIDEGGELSGEIKALSDETSSGKPRTELQTLTTLAS